MIGDISDTLILVLVAILLLSGQKDVADTVRNLGKTIEEFRRKQNEFKTELLRELNETNEIPKSIAREISLEDYYNRYLKKPTQASNEKIRELEEQIAKLRLELERMKKGDGKN
ncbi:MAG: twin-arginine translocase TatA/TatE family subunit [Acidianus infernus]|nr:twin-arginine translocase TatA/TatE family subunit [Acidianus infernus]